MFRERQNKFGQDEIIGHVEYLHGFYSYNLRNERDIIIWLPPSYQSSNKNYPVLYMPDGQNLFSPHTAYIGYDWRVDETLTKLIDKNEIEEIIVVGIYNHLDRLDEYNYFTKKGKLYAGFIIKELKKYIDSHYRTKSDARNTAVMGSSLGGLNAFQLAWFFPDLFGKAACLSNSFWVDERRIFKIFNGPDGFSETQKIYIDCGTNEKKLIKDNRMMCRILKEKGFGKILQCYFEKGGNHSEIDWAKRIHIPLKYLFGIKNYKKPAFLKKN
ncbi:MAG: alpha/beta hydrolase-fold protein [Bacteroidota bacterium]